MPSSVASEESRSEASGLEGSVHDQPSSTNGTETEFDPPIIIGQLDPKPSRARVLIPPGPLQENGVNVIGTRGKPLKNLPMIPRHLPATLNAERVEEYFRYDSRCSYTELWSRMPAGTPQLNQLERNTYSMRRARRVRIPNSAIGWDAKHKDAPEVTLQTLGTLSDMQIALNTSWPLTLGILGGIKHPSGRLLPFDIFLDDDEERHTPTKLLRAALTVLNRPIIGAMQATSASSSMAMVPEKRNQSPHDPEEGPSSRKKARTDSKTSPTHAKTMHGSGDAHENVSPRAKSKSKTGQVPLESYSSSSQFTAGQGHYTYHYLSFSSSSEAGDDEDGDSNARRSEEELEDMIVDGANVQDGQHSSPTEVEASGSQDRGDGLVSNAENIAKPSGSSPQADSGSNALGWQLPQRARTEVPNEPTLAIPGTTYYVTPSVRGNEVYAATVMQIPDYVPTASQGVEDVPQNRTEPVTNEAIARHVAMDHNTGTPYIDKQHASLLDSDLE